MARTRQQARAPTRRSERVEAAKVTAAKKEEEVSESFCRSNRAAYEFLLIKTERSQDHQEETLPPQAAIQEMPHPRAAWRVTQQDLPLRSPRAQENRCHSQRPKPASSSPYMSPLSQRSWWHLLRRERLPLEAAGVQRCCLPALRSPTPQLGLLHLVVEGR